MARTCDLVQLTESKLRFRGDASVCAGLVLLRVFVLSAALRKDLMPGTGGPSYGDDSHCQPPLPSTRQRVRSDSSPLPQRKWGNSLKEFLIGFWVFWSNTWLTYLLLFQLMLTTPDHQFRNPLPVSLFLSAASFTSHAATVPSLAPVYTTLPPSAKATLETAPGSSSLS